MGSKERVYYDSIAFLLDMNVGDGEMDGLTLLPSLVIRPPESTVPFAINRLKLPVDKAQNIRLRLVATKGGAPFALKGEDGKYLPDVLLDLDYWALMPW